MHSLQQQMSHQQQGQWGPHGPPHSGPGGPRPPMMGPHGPMPPNQIDPNMVRKKYELLYPKHFTCTVVWNFQQEGGSSGDSTLFLSIVFMVLYSLSLYYQFCTSSFVRQLKNRAEPELQRPEAAIANSFLSSWSSSSFACPPFCRTRRGPQLPPSVACLVSLGSGALFLPFPVEYQSPPSPQPASHPTGSCDAGRGRADSLLLSSSRRRWK